MLILLCSVEFVKFNKVTVYIDYSLLLILVLIINIDFNSSNLVYPKCETSFC